MAMRLPDPDLGRSMARLVLGLFARAASIFFGYRILHHEVYETESAEVVLIGLGLFLMGVPPAMFFDYLRRASETIQPAPEKQDRDDSHHGPEA